MAAQFYARYIPPANPKLSEPSVSARQDESKKRKRDKDNGVDLEPSTLEGTRTKGNLLPHQEFTLNHNRTIEDGDEDSRNTRIVEDGTKKQKKKAKHSNRVNEEQHGPPQLVDRKDENSEITVKNRKKRKKGDDEDSPLPYQDGPDSIGRADLHISEDKVEDGASKHKKILSKFERSNQVAAKLSKRIKQAAEGGEKDDQTQAIATPIEAHGLVPLPQPPEVQDASPGPGFSSLPDWLAHPMIVSSTDTVPFGNLSLSSSTMSSLRAKGYVNAFAIQRSVLPMLLSGPDHYNGDLCISATTGSGKTLAYVLPMVERLRNKPVTRLRGLIVVPTRELVNQVKGSLEACSSGSGLKIGTAVGSKTLREEQALLIKEEQKYDPQGYKQALRNQMNDAEDYMNWDDSFDETYETCDSDETDEEDESLVDYVTEHNSRIDILICTPGRLVDHMKSTKGFTLDHVQWLVVDEADRLLDESFQQWVDIVVPALERKADPDAVAKKLEKLLHIHEPREVQKIILSATMTKDISKLLALKLRRPRLVVLENAQNREAIADHQSSASIALQSNIDLPITLKEATLPIRKAEEKPLYLIKLLSDGLDLPSNEDSKPRGLILNGQSTTGDTSSSSESDSDSSTSTSGSSSNSNSVAENADLKRKEVPPSTHGVLIFTNNNENALRLARLLVLLRPYWAKHINSLTKSTATSAGRKALAAFRRRKLSVLIASDRASRGLDIENLAHVVNYDMPSSLTSYVHRIGRTARAGKPGKATTLVAHHEGRWFANEIAKSSSINRANKVTRIEWRTDVISEDDREAYEVALRQLGKEARGETA